LQVGEAGLVDGASVVVRLDAASIDTGNTIRDNHLRAADLLDVATHKEITFVGRTRRIEHDHAELIGELSIQGVARSYRAEAPGSEGPIHLVPPPGSADLRRALGSAPVRLTGRFAVSRAAFGMDFTETTTWDKRALAVRVDDRVFVTVDLELRPCEVAP
jgi:polyisoprenoid-binding protein YceI